MIACIHRYQYPALSITTATKGSPMDITATNYVWYRLQKFEQSIDDTARHFSELDSFGPWYASAPYYERCTITALLDSLQQGRDSDYAAIVEEYRRIIQKFEDFKKEKGLEYRDRLFEDLRNYTSVYHAAVCFAHLGQNGPDITGELSRSFLLWELCSELKGMYDLSDIIALIAQIDACLPPGSFLVPDDRTEEILVPVSDCRRSPPEGIIVKKRTGNVHSE